MWTWFLVSLALLVAQLALAYLVGRVLGWIDPPAKKDERSEQEQGEKPPGTDR